jgi:phosphoglycerate dehydrogenase-like enzyme
VRRLKGAELLLIGLGAIGRAVAGRARALEMRVVFFDPHLAEPPPGLIRAADLDTALPSADIVSLHLPLTATTRHVIDGRRIALMKPGALLINTARGGLLESNAVCAGLRSGRLAGAGLDVWETEPPAADDPLFSALAKDEDWLHGRLVVTPHVAGISAASIRDMRVKAVETARDYLTTGALRHCVNREMLGRRN